MPIEPYRKISDMTAAGPAPHGQHPDIKFMRNVTGAFVAPGITNPRESIAYFGFWNDGLLEPVALGLKFWNGRVRER
jgi:hypothetical protein